MLPAGHIPGFAPAMLPKWVVAEGAMIAKGLWPHSALNSRELTRENQLARQHVSGLPAATDKPAYP